MTVKVGAVVLAAGFSRRFGSPKLLAPLPDGRPLFAQTLNRLDGAVTDRIVVTRPGIAEQLSRHCEDLHVFPGSDRGMGATLAHGISLIRDWDACLVCLADMPFIETATYAALAARATPDQIAQPVYQGRPGHPVVFGSAFFAELRQLDGDDGGRPVLQRHRDSLQRLKVDDAAVLQDIDTPEDLADSSRED